MAEDDGLFEQGLQVLRDLLGPAWDVAVPQMAAQSSTRRVANPPDDGAATVVHIRNKSASGPYAEVLVEAIHGLTPAAARQVLRTQLATMEGLRGRSAALVIAPWLSPRTRTVLDDRGCGYLDLTGNTSLRLDEAGLFIRIEGARQAPFGHAPQGRSLTGTRAGRLVRILVDVAPPYRPTDLAATSRLSLAYVSRLLDVMIGENLVERHGRQVTDVDWIGLIRARAEAAPLLPPGRSSEARWTSMLAPKGVPPVLRILAEEPAERVAVTGLFAAAAVAPRTVGGQLMLYFDRGNPAEFGAKFNLIPTEHAADVVLIRAPDPVVFAGLRSIDGVPQVALSQLAIDCLGGPGRLPAAGEAVLDMMAGHEADWRLEKLSGFGRPVVA